MFTFGLSPMILQHLLSSAIRLLPIGCRYYRGHNPPRHIRRLVPARK